MEACELQHGGERERKERRDVGKGGEDRREMKCSTSVSPPPPSPLFLTVMGCVLCVRGSSAQCWNMRLDLCTISCFVDH